MPRIRVGIVILPEHRWPEARRRWRAAEEYGFDHAWTYDHIGWRSLVDEPWFDAVSTLTAAAMVTDRIRIGPLVASPNFRHPVPFARSVLALDDISGGRLTLGLGSGGLGDYDNIVTGGHAPPARERVDRFGEFVELTDALLTNQRTTFHGKYYTAVDARGVPGCVQRPRVPFLIAANGPRSMRVVARFGEGWVVSGQFADTAEGWWRALAERSASLDDALIEAGRDPAEPQRHLNLDSSGTSALTSVEYFADALGRAAEVGFTDVVMHWPRADGVYAGSEAMLERIAAEVLAKPSA